MNRSMNASNSSATSLCLSISLLCQPVFSFVSKRFPPTLYRTYTLSPLMMSVFRSSFLKKLWMGYLGHYSHMHTHKIRDN